MIDYRHPNRPTTRTVRAGETVKLQAGESVSLTPRGGVFLVTKEAGK